jgi:hypothetical protein
LEGLEDRLADGVEVAIGGGTVEHCERRAFAAGGERSVVDVVELAVRELPAGGLSE